MNRTRLLTSAFLGTFLVHASAQFVSWARADAIQPSSVAHVAFSVLSFPAFYLVSSNMATLGFWPTFLVSSALWAVVVTAAIAAFTARREAVAPPN